jgi:hypothetical protein
VIGVCMNLNLSFWKNASQKRKRIYSITFVFLVAVLVTVIGSTIPLSSSDAYTISQSLNATLSENRANNTLTQYIFINNFSICLLMFIPIAGAALGMFILFNTGVALGAIAATQGYPVYVGLLSLVATPIFWIEFVAYSIAMAESIWLFRRLTQKRWLEFKWTALFIGSCAGLLAIGAVVEAWLITVLG